MRDGRATSKGRAIGRSWSAVAASQQKIEYSKRDACRPVSTLVSRPTSNCQHPKADILRRKWMRCSPAEV